MSLVPAILKNELRKPTALIHFERDLSLLEQKIMTLLIFHCQISQKDARGFYYIKKSLIRQFIGWDDSKNYPRIYEAFEAIYNNSIKWNFLGADRTFESLRCRLIVSLLEPSKTGHYIGFQLHQDLEPVIRNPKVFARLKLIMMVILVRPKYCYPLYELVADSYCRGQDTVKVPLAVLKSYLGIAAGSYTTFKDLKIRVLKPSIDGINNLTDYWVTYQPYREGRTIGGLVLHIRKQPWEPPVMLAPLKELQAYYSKLPEMGNLEVLTPEEQAFVASVEQYRITESDARLAIEMHGLKGAVEIRDYVLEEVRHRQGKKNQVQDIGAYMARCLREGFGKTTGVTPGLPVAVAEDIRGAQQQNRERVCSEVEQLMKDFWAYQVSAVDTVFANMADADKLEFQRQFISENPLYSNKFRESGIKMPLVRAAFYKFAAQQLLTPDQNDVGVFAESRGVSLEARNLLDSVSR